MSGLSTLPLNGEALQVKREFIMAARIEERFGPLRPLIARLGDGNMSMTEIADLYEIALASRDNPPAREAIEAHIIKAGVAGALAPLAELVSALFIGHERFEQMREARAKEGTISGANGADPMTAASRGAT